jgi:hypothetical protein
VTVRAMIAAGLAAARAARRAVWTVFLVELAVSVVFTLAAGWTLSELYAARPLFSRGVEGDLVALLLALEPSTEALRALAHTALALLVAWKVASLWLGAGLAGALAGKGFAETAAARFGAFVRLALWSIPFYAAVALIGLLGLAAADPRLDDLLAWTTIAGPPLAGLAPAALLLLLTAVAIDHARAHLVVHGGGATRALRAGLRAALSRPSAVVHYLAYLATWALVSALYVLLTAGPDFPGAGGALVLLVLRQTTAAARFWARAVATGGQLAARRAA